MTTHSRRILLLCPDVITERMAGPAIRYWEFAKALAGAYQITLAAPGGIPESLEKTPNVRFAQHNPDTIGSLCAEHDIIIFQGNILRLYPEVKHSDKILVADLYDPIPLESLEQYADAVPWDMLPHHAEQVSLINEQLKYADYFLCANERQKTLWTGSLLSLGRINPLTHKTFSERLLVVPFGLPSHAPHEQTVPKKEKTEQKFTLLWGGGIWEWFDPLTVIRAVHRARKKHPGLRLIFLGTQHPNPGIPNMPMQERAVSLAKELGAYGKIVFFQDGWVPYAELQNHLLSADAGVSAHTLSLETHYSFRTRILHYLWAGKPIITTSGDVLAQQIEEYGAGIVVEAGDEEAWEKAFDKLFEGKFYRECVAGTKKLAERYTWPIVVQPLHSICAQTRNAEDIYFEEGRRKLRIADHELEHHVLENELNTILNSNSWRLTSALRGLRRMLKRS